MNRLNLDFSLSSDEARAEYVQTYIQNFDAEKPLTSSELEKIADYLLWGGYSLYEKSRWTLHKAAAPPEYRQI